MKWNKKEWAQIIKDEMNIISICLLVISTIYGAYVFIMEIYRNIFIGAMASAFILVVILRVLISSLKKYIKQ